MAAPLPYILITVKTIDLQKVSVSDMQNLKTFLTHKKQKIKNFFWIFCCIFEILFKFWAFWKKTMTLIAEVFRKWRTPKNMVTSMSKQSRFKEPFGKQHGKRAQILFELQWQHLYHIHWSLWMQLIRKKFMLLICKIWILFPNTLSVNGKYSLFNRDNLTQPI